MEILPLYSRLCDPEETSGDSWHQQATWEAITDPAVDAVINRAATGDGKSRAAFGAFDRGILALYPTNELVRDQERQLATYHTGSVARLTGPDLDRWARQENLHKSEILIDQARADVLLTNPDLFYFLHQGNYLREYLRQGGESVGLWQQIDRNYQALILDEFHLYSPPQVAGVLNTILLMRAVGIQHKYLFLSATPNPYLSKALRLAGLSVRVIDPVAEGAYDYSGGPGWRKISQSLSLDLIPQDRAIDWIRENADQILQFWLDHPGSKGAIIVNSVASAKRIKRILSPLFQKHGLEVSENTGFTDRQEAQEAIRADLIVGTSTLDVGVDFQINWLLFEGHDAPVFLQRLGRLGRHPGFCTYRAFAFVPKFIYERIQSEDPESLTRQDLSNLLYRVYPSVQRFQSYYSRWAPVQAYGIGAQLLESDLEGRYRDSFDRYSSSAQELWGEPFRKVVEDISVWRQGAEEAGLREGNPIVAEALSFRGTSSLQCAVRSESGSFLSYDLPTILSNYKFHQLGRKDFPTWFKVADYTRFHLQIDELLESRRFWRFIIPEWKASQLAGRVITLSKLSISSNDGRISEINKLLKRTARPAFIAPTYARELKEMLRLPLHFRVYDLQTQVEERYPIYSIAFDQEALMLDSLLGQGSAVTRDMLEIRCREIKQWEIEDDDKFLRSLLNN